MNEMKNSQFQLDISEKGVAALRHPEDSHAMNWVEGEATWGMTRLPEGITCQVKRSFTAEGNYQEHYCFTNTTGLDIFTCTADIAIYATFNDSYPDAATCMTQRCHAHIWCGGESSYVMALRMGGQAPHLGLMVTQGGLEAYSVERDEGQISNDRGDFLLHPSPAQLGPGESFTIAWELFWHEGKQDFYKKLLAYSTFMAVRAERYVLFQGEPLEIQVPEGTIIFENGAPVQASPGYAPLPGEHRYDLAGNGVSSWCRVLVVPQLSKLAQKRCNFIVSHQQFLKPGYPLHGAYLIYDNEEKHQYYNHLNDHNGGRERLGMGVLLAYYLQHNPNRAIENSLKLYSEYVLRELFEETTGEVFNDIRRCNDYQRLYNNSWMAVFFMELYRLWGNTKWLEHMVAAMCSYYEKGGAAFYAIGIQMPEMLALLDAAGMAEEKDTLQSHFMEHADTLLRTGTHYPPSEVNYEQSIVAPVAQILLDAYIISGRTEYLEGGKVQMAVLELFNGQQPDAYLNEVSIRHWDGFWFGKRRLYGDTFPHYWSALTGLVYKTYCEINGDTRYRKTAEASLRGVLPLILADGSASCARVHPLTVNGRAGDFYDPWANDQDWGLYFMLKLHAESA